MENSIIHPLKEGFDLFLQWTFPLGICIKKGSSLAAAHPKTALCIISVTAFFLGFVRLITFPLLVISGLFIMPFVAVVKKIQNKDNDVIKLLVAWGLSLLSLVVIIGLLASVIICSPPWLVSIALSLTLGVSVIVTCFQINSCLYK